MSVNRRNGTEVNTHTHTKSVELSSRKVHGLVKTEKLGMGDRVK